LIHDSLWAVRAGGNYSPMRLCAPLSYPLEPANKLTAVQVLKGGNRQNAEDLDEFAEKGIAWPKHDRGPDDNSSTEFVAYGKFAFAARSESRISASAMYQPERSPHGSAKSGARIIAALRVGVSLA
jgi:hypothetical protein